MTIRAAQALLFVLGVVITILAAIWCCEALR
jgi:hypothetical protein